MELWRVAYESGQYRRCRAYPDGTTERADGKNGFPQRQRGEILVAEPTRDQTVIGWVKQLFAWYAEGHPAKRIADRLNDAKVPPLYTALWLGPTVQQMLQNPIYATGVPVWNKAAHGRFLELVNGEYGPVERIDGRAKAGRRRTCADHIKAAPKPEYAIIDPETWDAVQTRMQAMRATPKAERRRRNPDLYLSGLVVCSECDKLMVAWAQQGSYRCSTNMHYARACRCNRTRHDVLEDLVLLYLEQTRQAQELLYADPDHSLEVWESQHEPGPAPAQYLARLTRLWRAAKQAGHEPPARNDGARVWTSENLRATLQPGAAGAASDLEGRIKAKEQEKDRLAKRLGLLDDEDAAAAVAARMAEVARELRTLRDQARPATDQFDALRDAARSFRDRTAAVRRAMEEVLARDKGQYVRSVIRQIRGCHQERRMGKLRASRLVRVEIVPAVGQPVTLAPTAEVPEEGWPVPNSQSRVPDAACSRG